jgi:hypothetical protein
LLLSLIEVHRLGDELESAKFAGAASALVVAIGSHHHDRQIRATLFDLTGQLQPVHTRHIDVRQDRNQRGLNFLSEPIQRLGSGSSKMHHIGSLSGLTAKALAKEVGHIGLIVHN